MIDLRQLFIERFQERAAALENKNGDLLKLSQRGIKVLQAMDKVAEKSIASVVRRFRADLRNFAVLGFVSDRSILSDLRALVRDAVDASYKEGLAQGGVEDEISSEDNKAIADLTSQQLDHVTDFVRAVREAKDDKAAQRDILDNRIDMWTTAIEMAGIAGLNSAKKNEMVIFGGTDGEESCSTCQRLKGQRHRRKWFEEHGLVPRDPRFRDNFVCKGYRCQHELMPI